MSKLRKLILSISASIITVAAGGTGQAAYPGMNGDIVFRAVVAGESNIIVQASDGSRKVLTANGRNDYYPSFSPDGSKIAYQSHHGGNAEIHVIKANGTGDVRLTSSPGPDRVPSWSPDGKWIVFERKVQGDEDIYAMRPVPGAIPIRITSDRGVDIRPAWSPDGTEIAFMSDRDGDFEIYSIQVDLATSTPGTTRKITDNLHDDGSPDWAPSGNHLTFAALGDWVRGTADDMDIFVVRKDGSDLKQLTSSASQDHSPDWSPDGNWIVFTSDRSGNSDLYRMPVTGEAIGLYPVTSTPDVHEHSPDWQRIAI